MTELERLLITVFEDDLTDLDDGRAFADVQGWDSLKHAELIVGIEERFGVELTREEIERIVSKATLRAVLAEKGHDV